MDRFDFKLQKVLDFKLGIEEKKKQEFVNAQKNYLSQEAYVNELKEQREREINSTRNFKNSFEYQNYFRYIDFLDNKIADELDKLESLARTLNEKKLELVKSTSDRKSIEKLREKAQLEFEMEVARKDQKLNDDFAMFSYFKQERR